MSGSGEFALVAILCAGIGFIVAWAIRSASVARLEERLQNADDAPRREAESAARLRDEVVKLQAESRAQTESAISALLRANQEQGGVQSAEMVARAKERLDAAAEPIAKKLAELDALIHRVETTQAQKQGEVIGQIKTLGEATAQWSLSARELQARTAELHSQTSTLATALRNPRAQGEWGEIQLRRVVELAGMSRFADFTEQESVATEDGRVRPDVKITLPGNQFVFIDSKAPIGGMVDIAAAPDEAVRADARRAHATAIKSAVDGLARKGYQEAPGSLDFVVMFVPGEGALETACTTLPSLVEDALAKRVLLASPLSLILLLRSFALGWQRVAQNDNAKAIAKLGGELYDSLATFGEHFAETGKYLERAVASFDAAVGSYQSRVLVRGKRIKEHAALPDDDLVELKPIGRTARAVPRLPNDQPSLLPALDAEPE